MTSNWFIVGDYINVRVHLCLWEGWREVGEGEGKRDFLSFAPHIASL